MANNEMFIDDGDNLVGDAWMNLVQSSPALQQALQEQATARFLEMTPAVMKVANRQTTPFDFATLLEQ